MISRATPKTEKIASHRTARHSPRAVGLVRAMDPSHDEIACCAYEIYVRSDMKDGRSREHWYQAESELRRQRIRDALMCVPPTAVSQDERYGEVLNGRNPRADAKLTRAVNRAELGKPERRRTTSAPTPHVEIPSTREANLNQGASP